MTTIILARSRNPTRINPTSLIKQNDINLKMEGLHPQSGKAKTETIIITVGSLTKCSLATSDWRQILISRSP